MLAYNLLLSVFPLALLALFIAGQVLESSEFERTIFEDLQQLFPSTADRTLEQALDRVRDGSTGFGIVALVTSIWFGSSVWGALDTAFCQIYHVRCRSWVEQKRFGFVMLGLVLLFMAATVAVPIVQGILAEGARDLPLGLSGVRELVFALTLAISVGILFSILCVIYWTVPNRRIPWRAVWPGAALATLAIVVVDYGFPVYLTQVSTLPRLGTTFVFVLIVLIWFYVLAFLILVGAVVNAMRFELYDTGELTAKS